MSRHVLLPRKRLGLEIAVGWDPPLSTFFAQVFDHNVDEDDPKHTIKWIGCTPGEFRDPLSVIEAVRPYAEIPDDLHATLYAEAHG